jgi:Domain of unknown function (DUF4157)
VPFAFDHQRKMNKSSDKKSSTPTKDLSSEQHDGTNNLSEDSPDSIFYLQRAIGNQAVQRLMRTKGVEFDFAKIGILQRKLNVSQPEDESEQEADSVAHEVMRMIIPQKDLSSSSNLAEDHHGVISRRCSDCEVMRKEGQEEEQEEEIPESQPWKGGVFKLQLEEDEEIDEGILVQKKHADKENIQVNEGQKYATSSRSCGQPMSLADRAFFEPRFRQDFSRVAIHTDSTANFLNQRLNARAFTMGQDIYFSEGEYRPDSSSGKELIAHELTHVLQQSASSGNNQPIQRAPKNRKKKRVVEETYQVFVPESVSTQEEMYRLVERVVYGREVNHNWVCYGNVCDVSKVRGKPVLVSVPASEVEQATPVAEKMQQEKHKKEYLQSGGSEKREISEEVDKRYREISGDKPGKKIKKEEKGKARTWERQLDEVLTEKEGLEKLPEEIRQLMGGESTFKPKDYQQLQRIAEKLRHFNKEDFVVYKLLTIRATDNLDLFEKSVDMYLARKEELRKALEKSNKAEATTKEPSLEDVIAEKWTGLDESTVEKMSEEDRYELARQKTSEITQAQLKYMKEHPGETLKDFAKAAALMNTGETFKGIGKDLAEAANGDANTWARWAAGAGAGAKLSGWLLAVSAVIFVASWLTGIGELATIVAAGAYLLGATMTLSLVESELRIKAASQATTAEEFKRNVEAAGAARANVIVGAALIVVSWVLHFTAKALFPKTIQNIKTSLKNLRERIRLKGSVNDLKPEIVKEMGARKGELIDATEVAKKKALDAATELEGLSTEQFVDKLEKGDSGGFLDQSKVAPQQKVNYRELLNTKEGRAAIEVYKQKLVKALKTDVVSEIDALAKEYMSKIDEFLKDVEAAKNHDDLSAATDKLEGMLGEEHIKEFMQKEQEAITKKKAEEAGKELEEEIREARERAEKSAETIAKMAEDVAKTIDPGPHKVGLFEGEVEAIADAAGRVVVKAHVGPFFEKGGISAVRQLNQIFSLIFSDAVTKVVTRGLTLRIGDDLVSGMTRVQLRRLANRLEASGISAKVLTLDTPEIYPYPVEVTNLETGAVRTVNNFEVFRNGFIEIPAGSNPEKILQVLRSLAGG